MVQSGIGGDFRVVDFLFAADVFGGVLDEKVIVCVEGFYFFV